MSEDNDNNEFNYEEYIKSLGSKELKGKFLAHVKPEDLDEEGRFICNEPVLMICSHAFEEVKDKLTYAKIFGVISIEDEAFDGCEKLEQADIDFEHDYHYPENYDIHMFWKNETINSKEDYDHALDLFCSKFGTYNVHIKDAAFNNCKNLRSFHFPENVVLHGSPFTFCDNLHEITIDGAIRLNIDHQILEELDLGETPFRSVTFKDCDNVQKMNIGKGTRFLFSEIVPFEKLQELNLGCGYTERRRFWLHAPAYDPRFFLILPTGFYRDTNFIRHL